MLPELNVYSSTVVDGIEHATVGIADATSFDDEGRAVVVVDWKSDVQPATPTVNHYRSQVRAYLDMTGTERGLIVMMTSGEIIAVSPTQASGPA